MEWNGMKRNKIEPKGMELIWIELDWTEFDFDFTLTSLWSHFDFTLISLGSSPWFHCGLTFISREFHWDFTLTSHCSSPWGPLDLTIHFAFTSQSPFNRHSFCLGAKHSVFVRKTFVVRVQKYPFGSHHLQAAPGPRQAWSRRPEVLSLKPWAVGFNLNWIELNRTSIHKAS